MAGAALLLLLLRLPSLLEPAWYADEGTYSDIGRALDLGAGLYRDVWDNKPPGIYWLTALLELRGPSVALLHGFLALVVAATAVAVWLLGERVAGRLAAILSTFAFLVLASLPNLDGDLYNAEPVGAAFAAFAVLLMLGSSGREVPAGVLAGLSLLFKEVFAADLLVVMAIPVLLAGGRLGRRELRAAGLVAAGAGLVLLAAAVPLAIHGSLGSAVLALTLQDAKYVGWSNGIGGGPATVTLTLLSLTRLVGPVVGGAVAAAWLLRRGRPGAAVIAWWLGCDLAATMLSARGLTHYVQQAEPALALLAGMAALAVLKSGRRLRPALAAGLLLLTFPAAQLTLWLPRAEVALAQGEPTPAWEHGNFRSWQLPGYYSAAWLHLSGNLSDSAYAATFPGPVASQAAVAKLFRECSSADQRVFVWGTVHWAYALSDRLPAGRFVSLNTAFSLEPHNQDLLFGDLSARPPAVLVVTTPPPPALSAWLGDRHYARGPSEVAGYPYWVAPGSGCQAQSGQDLASVPV